MSRLTGPEFFQLKGLRRVRRGGLECCDGHYYDQGVPVSGCLIPDIVVPLPGHGCTTATTETSAGRAGSAVDRGTVDPVE